jgi:hypothetical protein
MITTDASFAATTPCPALSLTVQSVTVTAAPYEEANAAGAGDHASRQFEAGAARRGDGGGPTRDREPIDHDAAAAVDQDRVLGGIGGRDRARRGGVAGEDDVVALDDEVLGAGALDHQLQRPGAGDDPLLEVGRGSRAVDERGSGHGAVGREGEQGDGDQRGHGSSDHGVLRMV